MPQHEHDPYASFTAPSPHIVTVEALRVAFEQRIGEHVLRNLRASAARDHLTDTIVHRIETSLLAETLPPLTLDNVEHFTVPRYAAPWEHFKARYWERGWVWYLRDWGWIKPPRTVDEPHSHRTTVQVRTRWTYPRSNTVLPGDRFGHPVMQAETSFQDARVRPW